MRNSADATLAPKADMGDADTNVDLAPKAVMRFDDDESQIGAIKLKSSVVFPLLVFTWGDS